MPGCGIGRVGAGVSPTSGATSSSQPVSARTSSTVWPGWTEARCASPPSGGKRKTPSVVTIADGPPPGSPVRFRQPGVPSPCPGEVT